ncbi:MAG: PhaM family polyhydroxyalkanoate granule multifunctional regulatory protein [Trinickia sp.]|uniref:PhaM family polyhydroxyalkanoate granule multifunctional regulatory protein n=1 Tax=Trinickia sp. TaxID=2571163 RepID=UPI003F803BE6
MTDTSGGKPPFPGFPGFPPAEMLDNMWDMMRLTPFGAAFPGMQPGSAQGFGAPLAAMSDMMSPLMNVEELDKRITDLRAVEQWLKLNLNMLQSAIQALEVQRATLSTLRAFGAFAQASMTQSAQDTGAASTQASSPWGTWASSSPAERNDAGTGESGSGNAGVADDAPGSAAPSDAQEGAPGGAAFDPSGWWNLLQSQFNQLAAFAMTQPGASDTSNASDASGGDADAKPASPKKAGTAGSPNTKAAAKRPPARKSASGSAAGATRGEK